MMRPFCVTPESGELPESCKIHGYDQCTFPFAAPSGADDDGMPSSSSAAANRDCFKYTMFYTTLVAMMLNLLK